jgi:hypothetical protein
MPFTPKDWRDSPDETTPLSAAALEDMETRLAAYSDTRSANLGPKVYNVLDYGIISHATTDQTAALATFYASIPSDSEVYFPAGTTVVGLHAPNKPLKLRGGGRGPLGTVFKPPSVGNPVDTKHVDFTNVTGRVVIEDIRLEGNASTSDNVVRGLAGGSQFTSQRFEVRNCWVRNYRQATAPVHGYGAAAAYAWPSAEFIFEDNIVEDCVHGPVFDQPGGGSKCLNNLFFSSTNDIFVWEVLIVSGGSPTNSVDGPMLVQGNDCIADTRDPENNGNTGSAIQVYNVRGVRVKGNFVRNCDGPGIRIGAGGWNGLVEGNDVSCKNWHGIYIETNIGDNVNPSLGNVYIALDQWTSAQAQHRGVRVIGNNVHHCTTGCGIEISYSPGSIVEGNEVHHNGTEGIKCDSERVHIKNNDVYNNWRHPTATPSGGGTMAEAQIRTWGRANKIVGNEIWDNFGTKTSDYGIAVTNDSHVIQDNQITDYVTAAVWQEGNGTTNIVRRNTGTPTTVVAAATLTLPPEPQGEIMEVTGATGITSITQSWAGRRVTLIGGTWTMTDGGNLNLTANHTSDANNSITLIAYGANWYEVARAVN